MRKSVLGVLTLVAVLFSFLVTCDVAWALKNVCPACKKLVENQDLIDCPFCGFAINKCLTCGLMNPIKNDHCASCSASMAESRVSRTIDKDTREDLRLGESPRAKIDVELQQIDQKVATTGLTSELAARQVELLVQMGWWSLANVQAIGFATQFPSAEQLAQVSTWRVTALKKLGFLALDAKNYNVSKEYLKTALSIDPKNKECQDLLKLAGEGK